MQVSDRGDKDCEDEEQLKLSENSSRNFIRFLCLGFGTFGLAINSARIHKYSVTEIPKDSPFEQVAALSVIEIDLHP